MDLVYKKIDSQLVARSNSLVKSADRVKDCIDNGLLLMDPDASHLAFRACRGALEDMDFELNEIKRQLLLLTSELDPLLLVRLRNMQQSINKIKAVL